MNEEQSNGSAPARPQTYAEAIHSFWANQDWSKPDYFLAFETQASPVTVSKWRIRVSHPVYHRTCGRKFELDWEKVDWAKNDSQLSRELGIGSGTIRSIRWRLNKPLHTQNNFTYKISPEQIDAIDWEWTNDVEIGKQFGVSRERARQLRNQYQKPQSKVFGCSLRTRELLRWVRDERENLKGKTMKAVVEMAPDFGFKRDYLYTLLERYQPMVFAPAEHKVRRGFDWDALNWRLPGIVLGMVYDFPAYTVNTRRCQMFKESPAWHLGGYSKLTQDEQFLKELEEEKKKAVALGRVPQEQRLAEWLAWKRESASKAYAKRWLVGESK